MNSVLSRTSVSLLLAVSIVGLFWVDHSLAKWPSTDTHFVPCWEVLKRELTDASDEDVLSYLGAIEELKSAKRFRPLKNDPHKGNVSFVQFPDDIPFAVFQARSSEYMLMEFKQSFRLPGRQAGAKFRLDGGEVVWSGHQNEKPSAENVRGSGYCDLEFSGPYTGKDQDTPENMMVVAYSPKVFEESRDWPQSYRFFPGRVHDREQQDSFYPWPLVAGLRGFICSPEVFLVGDVRREMGLTRVLVEEGIVPHALSCLQDVLEDRGVEF